MCVEARRKVIWAINVAVALFAISLLLPAPNSHIKVASSFTRTDIHAIRSEVSRKCWAEVRKTVAARDFKRVWHFALPVLFSRAESIAGFPGPPGGARVDCRGLFSDTKCAFMVFNNTNGWKCDRIDFIDAATMQQFRKLQKQYAPQQR